MYLIVYNSVYSFHLLCCSCYYYSTVNYNGYNVDSITKFFVCFTFSSFSVSLFLILNMFLLLIFFHAIISSKDHHRKYLYPISFIIYFGAFDCECFLILLLFQLICMNLNFESFHERCFTSAVYIFTDIVRFYFHSKLSDGILS